MANNSSQAKPGTLYRGIVIPASALSRDILTGDLLPGEEARIDEQGRQVVGDGNEYGVYMSDNPHMSEAAYATPRHTDSVAGSPQFRWRGSNHECVGLPRIGILYQVDTSGIDVRRPFITPELTSVYNNGFVGDEWIADRVPTSNYQIVKLKLGADLLHRSIEIPLDRGLDRALEALRVEVAVRAGRLATLATSIQDLPESRRYTEFAVMDLIEQMQDALEAKPK